MSSVTDTGDTYGQYLDYSYTCDSIGRSNRKT
jgi:hypothetical protein